MTRYAPIYSNADVLSCSACATPIARTVDADGNENLTWGCGCIGATAAVAP